MGGACSTNEGEKECLQVTGRKARGKGTSRKTKMQMIDLEEIGW
jgi:hypothetical protein